jgi:type IV secretory pathway VirB4 component
MVSKNELYGILTGLVEEHRKTENFFKGLIYKDNFFKLNLIVMELSSKFDTIQLDGCFDYESEDIHIKSFRFISFTKVDGMIEFIKEKYDSLIEDINIVECKSTKEEIIEIRIK